MNIKDLQYFEKLSELKNYSDTAHYYQVSQPTITYAIKRLEREYDADLIIRKSYANSVTLTDAGEQLMVHAKKILRENELIFTDLHRLKNKEIKMGFPPIISDYLVPMVFDELKKSDLLSIINPVRSGSKELLQELNEGKIDVSLLGTTTFPAESNFDFKIIAQHQFKIIASSRRHFPRELKMKDLQQEDVLILDESSVHKQIVTNLIEKYGVFTHVTYQTSDYNLLLDLVKENKGISLITETALKGEKGIQTLNVVDEKFPPFYLMLVYRNSIVHDDKLAKIIDIFSNLK